MKNLSGWELYYIINQLENIMVLQQNILNSVESIKNRVYEDLDSVEKNANNNLVDLGKVLDMLEINFTDEEKKKMVEEEERFKRRIQNEKANSRSGKIKKNNRLFS